MCVYGRCKTILIPHNFHAPTDTSGSRTALTSPTGCSPYSTQTESRSATFINNYNSVPASTRQEFLETMRQLTDGVHWRGIGGPHDLANVERSSFANAVREYNDQHSDLLFEKTKGAAASRRGAGASGWHLYNCALPALVERPTPHMDELLDRVDDAQPSLSQSP